MCGGAGRGEPLGRTFLFLNCCRARKPLHAAWKRVMFLLVCASRCSSSLASDPARKNTCGRGAGRDANGCRHPSGHAVPPTRHTGWWGCGSPLCSHWFCPVTGVLFPGHEECRRWEQTVLPLCCPAAPCRAVPPTPACAAGGTCSLCQASYPAQTHVVAALLQVQRLQELFNCLRGGRGVRAWLAVPRGAGDSRGTGDPGPQR